MSEPSPSRGREACAGLLDIKAVWCNVAPSLSKHDTDLNNVLSDVCGNILMCCQSAVEYNVFLSLSVLVPVRSMLPLFLKDGLLVPYVVTSLAFLFYSLYLLSALERCSEDELRLGAYRRLFFLLPKMDLACVVRWKVSK